MSDAGLRATIRELRDQRAILVKENARHVRTIRTLERELAERPSLPSATLTTVGKEDLTDRQQTIFDFVRLYVAEKGWPPTRAEIAAAFDFASVNAAEQHLRAIEKKGWVRIQGSTRKLRKGQSRNITILP